MKKGGVATSDPQAMKEIRKAQADIAKGKSVRLTKDDALGLIRRS